MGDPPFTLTNELLGSRKRSYGFGCFLYLFGIDLISIRRLKQRNTESVSSRVILLCRNTPLKRNDDHAEGCAHELCECIIGQVVD